MTSRPRLFVLGDSISMHYGPYLETALHGVFTYARKTGGESQLGNANIPRDANGGDSRAVLNWLRSMAQGGGVSADLLLLNCGLHDLKINAGQTTSQVSLDEYKKNLPEILRVARGMKLKVAWVRITPVDDALHVAKKNFVRRQQDVLAYNAVADEVMHAADVPACDLFTFTMNLGTSLTDDGVHFHEAVREKQAAFIAGWLTARFVSRS